MSSIKHLAKCSKDVTIKPLSGDLLALEFEEKDEYNDVLRLKAMVHPTQEIFINPKGDKYAYKLISTDTTLINTVIVRQPYKPTAYDIN